MVVGLGHFNKSASEDPLHLITGSRAFTAVVRAVLAAARDPDASEDTYILSQVKNNLGKLNLPNLAYVVHEAIVGTPEGDARVGRLHFTGESDKSVRDILAEAGLSADRTERAECIEWLRTELVTPQRSRDVEQGAKAQGFSVRTLKRARSKLGVKAEHLATGAQGRFEWWLSLPGSTRGDEPA